MVLCSNGHPNPEGATYCGTCHVYIEATAPRVTPESAPAEPAAPEPPPPERPPPEPAPSAPAPPEPPPPTPSAPPPPIPDAPEKAKVRHPLGVLALTLITLGIYGVFWWYFINRELAHLGGATERPELGRHPILAPIAITVGALVVLPPFVSFWRTLKRIEAAQNIALGSNNISPVLLFLLGLVPLLSLIVIPVMQSNLNQVWRSRA